MKGMKIGQYNIRSMVAQKKFEAITDLVPLFDIFCVSESWLVNPYPDNKIIVKHYQTFRLDRVVDKTGGGLLIYVHERLAPYCSIEHDLTKSNADIEMLVMNYTQEKHRLMTLVLAYRPPNSSYVRCLDTLLEACQSERFEGREMWVLGDMNINLLDPEHAKTKKYSKIMGDLALIDKINCITRPHPTGSGGTCIDPIATSCNIVMHSGTLPCFVSDHLPVYAVRKMTRIVPTNINVRGRSYRRYDVDNFTDYLLNADMSNFMSSNDADEMWCILLALIHTYLDKYCPIKDMILKDYGKEWMTKDLFELIHRRNETMHQYCIEGKNNPALLQICKDLRAEINIGSEIAQDNFMENKLDTLSNNPSKFWRELNTLLGKCNNNKPEIVLKHHVSGDEVRGTNVPGYINEFFSSVGIDLLNKLGNVPQVTPFGEPSTRSHEVTPDTVITYSEVMLLVRNIEIHKSSGIDNVSARVLKDALIILCPQLTAIINCSLHTVNFPAAWSTAKVVPLPKTGELKNIGNWRPISLLPAPSKIMERIIYTRIYGHLEHSKLLSKYQYGFRASRGTGDAVFSLVNDLYKSRDEDMVMATCFLDVRKAFDSIHHGELIARMSRLGIPVIYIDWLHAYLSSRKQRVICNNTISSCLDIKCGVPQGSIMGPLLFICFINCLPDYLVNCRISMYADDVVFYVAGRTMAEAQCKLQVDATNVFNWFSRSGLCINTEKTKVMLFTGRKSKSIPDLKIYMGNTRLKVCESYEYLGVILDYRLNLDLMINKTVSSASNRLYMYRNVRKKMSRNIARLVYQQTISPVLEYCGYLYNGLTETHQLTLQRIQNRCLRICLQVRLRFNVIRLHEDSDIDFVGVKHDLQLLLLLHKYVYSGNVDFNNKGLQLQAAPVTGMRTRSVNTGLLVYPQSKKNGFRKSPLYRGIVLWNSLPPTCRICEDTTTFKRLVKVILVSQHLKKWRKIYNLPT